MEQRYIEDPQLKKFVDRCVQARRAVMRKTTNKGDASVGWVGENGIEARMNFSVKKAESMVVDAQGNIKYADFYAVGNTPFSSVLLRDAEFSYLMFHNVIQLGVVHASRDKNASLNSLFDDVVHFAKTKALYNVITGELAENQNVMVNIQNKFISLTDIFENLLNGKGGSNILEAKDKKGNLTGGLTRMPYTKLNDWKDIEPGKTKEDTAKDRSEETEKEALDLMYRTKIKISITLRDLNLS